MLRAHPRSARPMFSEPNPTELYAFWSGTLKHWHSRAAAMNPPLGRGHTHKSWPGPSPPLRSWSLFVLSDPDHRGSKKEAEWIPLPSCSWTLGLASKLVAQLVIMAMRRLTPGEQGAQGKCLAQGASKTWSWHWFWLSMFVGLPVNGPIWMVASPWVPPWLPPT